MFNIKQKVTLIIIFLIFIFTLYSEDTKIDNKNSPNVIIIYAKSKYKLALAEAIENKLKIENISARIQ